ncbi:hypothetical protein RUND412_007301 [Rhizina undulata]
MASSLTSDQVNYLIWRYLQESGFHVSARSFQLESKVDRYRDAEGSAVTVGALVNLIQRGLQYIECTRHIKKDGSISKATEPFTFFPRPAIDDEDEGVGAENGHVEEDDDLRSPSTSTLTSTTQTTNYRKHPRDDPTTTNGVSATATYPERKRRKRGVPSSTAGADDVEGFITDVPPTPEELKTTNGCSVGTQVEGLANATVVGTDDLVALGTGDKGVTAAQWNPVHENLVATAGTDAMAQIWNVPPDTCPRDCVESTDLVHESTSASSSEVTALRWSPQGDLLATGTYDGQTRIWTTEGVQRLTLALHYGPVVTLRWSSDADILLALSCDGKVMVWETRDGNPKGTFLLDGDEAAAAVEWISGRKFVVGGNKGTVAIFNVEEGGEKKNSWKAHAGEVNALAFDSAIQQIATGGEDGEIALWSLGKDKSEEKRLKGHTKPIVAVLFQPLPASSPSSPSSPNSTTSRILASASEDCTIRLWDVVSGVCLHKFAMHPDPIERIAFSAEGKWIAGAAGGKVFFWRCGTGLLAWAYAGMTPETEIVGLEWSHDGRMFVGPSKERKDEDSGAAKVCVCLRNVNWLDVE